MQNRSKKQDSNPLAFLGRAKEEKISNARRQEELAMEHNGNWKKMDELTCNLESNFMEYENVWKQALGANLYSSNSMNVDQSVRQRMNMHTKEQQISREESMGIMHLLFKDGKGHLHDSWKQGFFFDQKIKYGLFQDKGGPCGILAVVQAFFLKHLLYGAKVPAYAL